MKQAEFIDLLGRFGSHPLPAVNGRHVYLWHGDLSHLTGMVPPGARRSLDLHTMAGTLPKAPYAIDEARLLLRRAIQNQLDGLRDPAQQQIVVVSGTDLLSRYRVPLQPFFAAASDRLLVIFAVPSSETSFDPATPLPDYVSLNPQAPLDFLRTTLDQPSVVVGAE